MGINKEGKRWHEGAGTRIEAPKVEAFLAEIAEVCRRHGFDIEHEDLHGKFVIESLADGEEPLHYLRHANLGSSIPVE